MPRSFIASLWLPLRIINEHSYGENYIRLVDDRGGHVAYVNTMIIPHKQTTKCLRQFIFNVGKKSYLATSTMQIGIERINKVEPHPYVKTGENVHHFRTTIGRPTRAQTRNKAKLKPGCLPRVSHISYSEEYYNEDKQYKKARRLLKVKEQDNLLSVEKRKLEAISKQDEKIAGYLKSLAERKKIERDKQDGIDTSLPMEQLPIAETEDRGYKDNGGKYRE